MNLFHLDVRSDHAEGSRVKTWLVIARDAAEARALVPQGQTVVAVAVQTPCKPGRPRILGWMGSPAPAPAAVRRRTGAD